MTKPDDSSLNPKDLEFVESRGKDLLDRADAWEVYPVPIDDLLDAANVKMATHSVFDPAGIVEYLSGKAHSSAKFLKSAVSKILGVYDSAENLIHVDKEFGGPKKTFLTLHETGHHELPVHKKMFRIFQDCKQTLAPHIADQFEREANNFARYVLFKGPQFGMQAADEAMSIMTAVKMSKPFGASIYASAREFARTHERACIVYVLEQPEFVQGKGTIAEVRRIEASPAFIKMFGYQIDEMVGESHPLFKLIPFGKRKVIGPTRIIFHDLNGNAHECVADSFDTTHNILILLYPEKELASQVLVSPAAE